VDEQLKQIFLKVAKKSLPPIQGQLRLIDRETEIVPGIQAVATPGHTPGHIAVAISSGGEQLLCISDAAIHPIHLEQPDWYAAVDLNPEQIATTTTVRQRRAPWCSPFIFPRQVWATLSKRGIHGTGSLLRRRIRRLRDGLLLELQSRRGEVSARFSISVSRISMREISLFTIRRADGKYFDRKPPSFGFPSMQ